MTIREEFEAFVHSQGFLMGYTNPAKLMERIQSGDYAITWVHGAWLGWQTSRAALEPSFYWPDGEEGGSSSVEEMAQDAYDWDGTLWEEMDVACAYELPKRVYRSFLDEKGNVQVERMMPLPPKHSLTFWNWPKPCRLNPVAKSRPVP
ncbi:hypothetical protein [Cupriavidus sp. CuC1]|uniref:hypothetical protein n=1 Tax=Cupriavidus sp. CuC1 TaxID=3373131 RepID=UPI0037CE9B16